MAQTAPQPGVSAQTKLARLFGLDGEAWMRHANPMSVWTRFTVLPLLVIAIWSRDWIGWWSLVPIALAIVWTIVNPALFAPPRSTRNWASKAVLGERVWAEGDRATFPAQFRSPVPAISQGYQSLGMLPLVYGLVTLDPIAAATGVAIVQGGKLWYLDRMVLLFEDVKSRRGEYAAWEY